LGIQRAGKANIYSTKLHVSPKYMFKKPEQKEMREENK